jgi:hypothetical protein
VPPRAGGGYRDPMSPPSPRRTAAIPSTRTARPRAGAACAAALAAMLVTSGCAGLPGVGRGDIPYPTPSPGPGMKPVSWSYFGFGVPREWRATKERESTYWHDAAGKRRLHAEVFTGCGDAAKPERRLPKLASYGSDGPLRLQDTAKFRVSGSAGGWRYELTGAGGERRTVLNTWIRGCDKEIWLVISASERDADRIADSVVAQAKP